MTLGRELIGSGGAQSMAVEYYRQRLLGRLGIGEGRGKKALDLGCGDGLEAVYLARKGYTVYAYDIETHPRWPELAKRSKGRIKFGLADATRLDKIKGSYDLVFQKDMLHHVAEPLAVLTAMKRLTKKGGRLLVVECNRLNPVFYLHLTLLGDHQHFTRARLSALMDKAGLKGWKLALCEARVWPWENKAFQDLMDWLQDIAEKMPFLGPFLCYHLATWER